MHRTRSMVVAAVILSGILLCLLLEWKSDRRTDPTETSQRRAPSAKPNRVLESAELRITGSESAFATAVANLLASHSDNRDSIHPVERAVARGSVFDTRVIANADGTFVRLRLAQTPVQDRMTRIVETGTYNLSSRDARIVTRDLYLADQIIVRMADSANPNTLANRLALSGMSIVEKLSDGVYSVRLATNDLDAVPRALEALKLQRDLIANVEGDGVGFGGAVPNDTNFSSQWALRNTGQFGGSAGVDIGSAQVWDLKDPVAGATIAVLDSGLRFDHPDLAGVSIGGTNFITSGVPNDDNGHGTAITGIMVANRNNSTGIAGIVNANVFVGKVLNAQNSGLTSDLIEAVTYARTAGYSVINLSLVDYPFNATLSTEFTACQTAGIVLCIAAGNAGSSNDLLPNYPSSYTHPNIIAVGAHTRFDSLLSELLFSSNFGLVSVDLFAPGHDVLTTIGTDYEYWRGTSVATAFVSSACSALKGANPTWGYAEIKAAILDSAVDRLAYTLMCVSNGRLNLLNSFGYLFRQLPNADGDHDTYSDLFEYLGGTRTDRASSHPVVTGSVSGGFYRIGTAQVARPDASFAIETSRDLIRWSTNGVTDFSTSTLLSGGIPYSPSSKDFLRIRPVGNSP